jgi:hypothetical protein
MLGLFYFKSRDKLYILPNFFCCVFLPVCCEEESGWNLGMQGLREGQGWWCLYHEVFPLESLFFPSETALNCSKSHYSVMFICSTASAVTVRSTIRRLREQTEA